MRGFNLQLLLLLLLSTACNMQQDISIEVPSHKPVTFIECYLEPGQPARALATKSVDFFDRVEVVPADGLQFSLYHNGTTIPLENKYIADSIQKRAFNYNSTYAVAHEENREWELVVHRNEQEIARSTARFLPKPVVKKVQYSVGVADSVLSVEVQIEDNPQQENYYRLRLQLKGSSRGKGFEGLWTDQSATDGKLKLSAASALKAVNDTLIISVYHIDEGYYTFLRSLQKARDANYNPFAQPANVEGNLEGEALGIFTAISGTTDTLLIKR